ncbi:MAG: TIM barrel protein, partial [Deltaproteobacteria bacterium]|nr:TIM barrel protein [Deltaproteobacteria bacterium]
MGISPELLVSRVQVNIPFAFLLEGYLSLFLARGLNPEIGLDADSLSRQPPRTFRRIARAFQQAGRCITLHAPFQDLAPGSLDDLVLGASRARLRQAFRWLGVFRPAAVVCHLGYEARHYRWDLENWLNRCAATFRELAKLAAPLGVAVMLENVYETESELFVEVISRAQADNLQVCLDVGHLLAFGNGDFEGWL